MNMIICIDDDGGISFNNRRQSQDKVLNKRICELAKESKLWISQYSASLFDGIDNSNIIVNDNFLLEASENDYCFAERTQIAEYEKLINELIVVKWNRMYPSDLKLDIDLNEYEQIDAEEFEGNSHNKITMEWYKKC